MFMFMFMFHVPCICSCSCSCSLSLSCYIHVHTVSSETPGLLLCLLGVAFPIIYVPCVVICCVKRQAGRSGNLEPALPSSSQSTRPASKIRTLSPSPPRNALPTSTSSPRLRRPRPCPSLPPPHCPWYPPNPTNSSSPAPGFPPTSPPHAARGPSRQIRRRLRRWLRISSSAPSGRRRSRGCWSDAGVWDCCTSSLPAPRRLLGPYIVVMMTC